MSEYNMVATLRVMPEGVDIDLGALKDRIIAATPTNMKVHAIQEQPIAFGLVALDTIVLTNDKDGGDLDPVRDAYYDLEGVSEVDVTDVGRIID
ncbi:MAG: elongation factor 1-beta [Candidatus Methanofastidiosa archaeon]|nr:elongation factor 1-beta [Candidatus Methanofastidiosa archaeon]MDD4281077.1 elongation factor 1-beta [Candidatus Methanofastidiosa archaeon]